MTLYEKLQQDMKQSMLARDEVTRDTLRLVISAVRKHELEGGKTITDELVQSVLQSASKTRQESIEQFEKAGRTDLVDKETAEIGVLESYLPPAASSADIDAAVADAIVETGATSVKDIGKVMKAVMPRLAGKHADGRAVNEAVRRKLGA